jgi:hypothetical protein
MLRKVPQGLYVNNRMRQHTERDRNQKVPQGRDVINQIFPTYMDKTIL